MSYTLRIDFGYRYEKNVITNPFEYDYQFIKLEKDIDPSANIKIFKNWIKEWRGVGELKICGIEITDPTNKAIEKINEKFKNKIVGKIYKFNNND